MQGFIPVLLPLHANLVNNAGINVLDRTGLIEERLEDSLNESDAENVLESLLKTA